MLHARYRSELSREREQSQTQECVSRFEPLLYVPAFSTMKDFHYSWIPKITNSTPSGKNNRTRKFFHSMPQHLQSQTRKLVWGRNLYNTWLQEVEWSLLDLQIAHNKILEPM